MPVATVTWFYPNGILERLFNAPFLKNHVTIFENPDPSPNPDPTPTIPL
jgi:hypothetical protein